MLEIANKSFISATLSILKGKLFLPLSLFFSSKTGDLLMSKRL